MLVTSNFSFLALFSTILKMKFEFSVKCTFILLFENAFNLDQSHLVELTRSQTSHGFTCLQYKPFENTVGKGEIALTSNFSFPHSVFYPFAELLPFSSNLKLSSANSNSLPNNKILDFSKLKDFEDDNFEDNFKFIENGETISKRHLKHCRKRRNCSSRAIPPFPTVFTTDL